MCCNCDSGRCCSIWRIVQSAIGIFVGVSSAIVFYHMYGNGQAASWALLSGVFSAAGLHLAVLLHKQTVHSWYTTEHLRQIQFLGLLLTAVSLGVFGWYVFITVYYHIPMLPVDKSSIVTSVWVCMTAKWTFLMWYFAKLGINQHSYTPIPDSEFA